MSRPMTSMPHWQRSKRSAARRSCLKLRFLKWAGGLFSLIRQAIVLDCSAVWASRADLLLLLDGDLLCSWTFSCRRWRSPLAVNLWVFEVVPLASSSVRSSRDRYGRGSRTRDVRLCLVPNLGGNLPPERSSLKIPLFKV